MTKTECGHGHFYDSDMYAVCPYCNGGVRAINLSPQAPTPEVYEGKTVAPGFGAAGAEPERLMPNLGPAFGDGDEGVTVAPDAYRIKDEEEQKTVGLFAKQHNIDPVAGWLVCIEGAEKGRDYAIKARINSIGRSEKMDICIKSDKTISMEQHARLAYDPRYNNFSLIPGLSQNNIYINEEPMYVPTKLSAYDVIDFGETKLIFVPLCGERFQWKD